MVMIGIYFGDFTKAISNSLILTSLVLWNNSIWEGKLWVKVVLDILLRIERITKSVLHTFCSGVRLYLDHFIFSESGNITKRDLFDTNLGRFGKYYIRRCSQVIIFFFNNLPRHFFPCNNESCRAVSLVEAISKFLHRTPSGCGEQILAPWWGWI